MSETPVETIRRAAAKMRERAEDATPGPWSIVPGASNVWRFPDEGTPTLIVGGNHRHGHVSLDDAEHIASWHPVVALAVADWLEKAAERADFYGPRYFTSPFREGTEALAVARTYLGEAS